MTLPNGRIIRRGGLLIEVVALIGLMTIHQPPKSTFLHNVLAIGLGVGFFVWALGTAMIYHGRVLAKKRVRRLDL